MRVLIAEDDLLLGQAIRRGLELEGFTADWVTHGDAAEAAARTHGYEVIALDLGLPDIAGETLLQRWRAADNCTPVIVLTARGLVFDRVQLLDLGADDYLVKPFDLIELAARLRALARRGAARDQCLESGPVRLARATRSATRDGQRFDLTNREYRILEALLRHRNCVVSQPQLEEALYGWGEEVESNAIEVHIHHLRRKLGRDLIQTVRGAGYRICTPSHAES